jgi:hypothetical protein
MQYRRLGNSNLKVSVLCLGTMMFGNQTPFDEAAAHRGRRASTGSTSSTRPTSTTRGSPRNDWASCWQGQRQHWVLASKLGNKMSARGQRGPLLAPLADAARTEAILAAAAAPTLDILYLHRDYPTQPRGGAARAGRRDPRGQDPQLRLSNFRGWRIAEVVRLCKELGVPQPGLPALLQPAQPRPGSRDPAGLRPLRHRRGAVQPAGARRAHRQVPARPAAGRRHPRRQRRQAHPGDRVPRRVTGDRAKDQGALRSQRPSPRPVRRGLGAGQSAGQFGHRRAAHPAASGGRVWRGGPGAGQGRRSLYQ